MCLSCVPETPTHRHPSPLPPPSQTLPEVLLDQFKCLSRSLFSSLHFFSLSVDHYLWTRRPNEVLQTGSTYTENFRLLSVSIIIFLFVFCCVTVSTAPLQFPLADWCVSFPGLGRHGLSRSHFPSHEFRFFLELRKTSLVPFILQVPFDALGSVPLKELLGGCPKDPSNH